MTTVELVRHARARTRRQWSPRPDQQRPLDVRGRHQARWLAEQFRVGENVRAIIASPSSRCLETVEPLAKATGCAIATDERLADLREVPVTERGSAWVSAAWLGGRAISAIDEAVAYWHGGRLVVCSHGDVLAATMGVLVGRDRLAIGDAGLRKGAWFTLRFDDHGRCVGAVAHPAAPLH